MQYWDEVLFPHFASEIKGSYYGQLTEDEFDEDAYYLACKAIATFKFPHIPTEYKTFYGHKDKEGFLIATSRNPDDAGPNDVPHGVFTNDLTYHEIAVIVAWMKYYWAKGMLGDADNFSDMYTDSNIKSYSRANMVSKNTALAKEWREYAEDLENRYSRVKDYKPVMGTWHD